MNTTSQRRRLSNTTWVLGETPTNAKRKAAGCWVDQTINRTKGRKGGKSGGPGPASNILSINGRTAF